MNKNIKKISLTIENSNNLEKKDNKIERGQNRSYILKHHARNSKNRAYHLNSLGSIPSTIETILFYDPSIECKKGFNSQSIRFNTEPSVRVSDQFETTSDIKNFDPQYTIKNKTIKTSISSYKNKAKKDLPIKLTHFDKVNTNPGPGEYEVNLENNKKKLRYQSLFLSHDTIPRMHNCLQSQNNNLGPGTYTDNYKSKNNTIIFSKLPRFVNLQHNNKNLGPGKYNIDKNFENKRYNNQLSFFFQEKKEKKTLSPEKFIKIKEEPSIYNNSKNHLHKQKKNIKFLDFKTIKQEIEKSSDWKNQKISILKKGYFPLSNLNENELEHGKIKISLNTNEKRFKYTNQNHNPGPCYYYNPEKKYFHQN